MKNMACWGRTKMFLDESYFVELSIASARWTAPISETDLIFCNFVIQGINICATIDSATNQVVYHFYSTHPVV